jgi:hypothetical protein
LIKEFFSEAMKMMGEDVSTLEIEDTAKYH